MKHGTLGDIKLKDRLIARRRRKAHERYQRERARQDALRGQDAQEAVKKVTRGSGPTSGAYPS